MSTDTTTVRVASVRAELRTDSTDVAVPAPRLSWKSAATTPAWLQASAELRDGSGDTVTVEGRDSVLVEWPFTPLAPRERRTVSVRVTGVDGSTSEWSEPIEVVAAFLAEGEWSAPLVGLAEPAAAAQPALLRHEFATEAEVSRATLYATAHGAYQVWINGAEVDNQILKPGWTSYQWHLVHETTDVTALLRQGDNAIGVSLAGAWYTENFGFRDSASRFYGEQPAVAAQLVIEYTDGRTETVLTGADWRATGDGPVVASGIYAGESYDATREQAGWTEPGFDDSAWSAAAVQGDTVPTPQPRIAPAVRAIEEVAVREVITSPSGARILDFGQNLVGRLRITVRGERGTTLTLRHAEVLEHGELGIRPLRNAAATDHFTLAGTGEETWEPRFTFHGFRYAQLDGLAGELDASDVTAVVIHSDMARTGWFDSSHALVNRLHENVVWGMRGNFLYLPTDCPQRDERLGWTGDIQVFSPTASFLYEADAFLTGWLVDLALEQKAADGVVPFIIPSVLPGRPGAAAAWGDAATVVPTVLHERFGNLGVVADQYESMKAWADTLLGMAGDRMLWEDHFQFGDWLDPDASPDFPADAKTDADIVASAYLYRSVDFVVRAAELLGNAADAARYGELRSRIHAAFLAEYVAESGRMMSDAQTGYATAIMFGLYRDEAQRLAMGARLAVLVRSAGYRIGTGFVGTPLITDALTDTGHADTAARLLTQTENPSWLYPVTMGATTIWERWDSMLEDGTINPGEMTSFNHYALGAVADWLHRSVAGLAPAEPGYRTLRIQPHLLDGFDHATATHDTPYGIATAGWVRDGDTVTVSVVIPANTTAVVTLPGTDDVHEVGSGEHQWTVGAAAAPVAPGAVTTESSLAAVIDDPEAYAAVWQAIAAHSPEQAQIFRRHTKWTEGRALGEAFFQLSPSMQAEIGAALDALNAGRGAGTGATA
ncbi:alpha-L-rhamnosidase [Galbitalea soli]|uniref:alpha-L-rhamnosidase n=1 Tax=Galbitalea soli TaxID=1268042 RepID=A0A7C9TUZ8_9MICO|nr:alpha-L-rhamnosidase [Galbitalea soli]NEM92503.1 family 78 glycoside hydrolase catalytic domain [Galbitalea soli]NYJ29540.1 alpha-L-rhamnosidase [Galbitalea soli]